MTIQLPPRALVLSVFCALIPTALLLEYWPPPHHWFYPRCPIHEFLGVLCPGCGGTRAVAALLAGRCDDAIRFNCLIVALSPLTLYCAALQAYSAVRWNRWRMLRVSPLALRFLFVAAGVFTAARNIKDLTW
ncbi:MAG: DUF2752 domain-containing protein [Bryobacterales bacterium]|nr:DUF2752 domain-containing protein [Bryobacterales bacterium]